MAETLDNAFEEDMLPVLKVRVLDAIKKNSFRVRRLTNFPIAESLQDMKTALQKCMPDITHVADWQMGYVLERNKFTIETDGQQKQQQNGKKLPRTFQVCNQNFHVYIAGLNAGLTGIVFTTYNVHID